MSQIHLIVQLHKAHEDRLLYPRSIPYFAAWCIVLALLAFALQPALTRSHLEGFTYLTETMSMLAPDYSATEPLWRAGVEYFYLTRPGAIWAMAPFSVLFPGNGYQVLMWVTTPVFLSGLIVVARVWTGASWLACFAALLFIPIAIEVNFFTNDNVLAACFSLWGMVCLLRAKRLVFVVLAGALLCLAVLCRLDQVMLGPLFVVLAALKADTLRGAVLRCVMLGLGFLFICAAGAFIDPNAINILDRIAVARGVFVNWGYAEPTLMQQIGRDASTALIAFGLGLPALTLSVLVLLLQSTKSKTDRIPWLGLSRALAYCVVLLVYPLFVYAMTIGLYLDPRGFLTIVPMLIAIVARGLDALILGPLLSPGAFRSEGALNRGIIFATILGPVFVPVINEFEETESAAPHIFGRIWSADAWRDWQGYFSEMDETAERLIATMSRAPSSSVVVTWDWTSDRQFQNRLVARGFRPADVTEPQCLQNAEVWQNTDGAEVYHLRMHIPFAPGPVENTTAFFIDSGSDCLRMFPQETRYSIGGALLFPWAKPHLATAQTEMGWYQVTDEILETWDTTARRWMIEVDGGSGDVDALAQRMVFDADILLNPEN